MNHYQSVRGFFISNPFADIWTFVLVFIVVLFILEEGELALLDWIWLLVFPFEEFEIVLPFDLNFFFFYIPKYWGLKTFECISSSVW